MTEQPAITTEKRKLEEFGSVQEIVDALRKATDKERAEEIAKVIEDREKVGEASPVMLRMAMQSLGYKVPSMEQVEIFLRELKKKDGVRV